jgi:uncharacterized protein with PIN domain/sulfur carrier protein ThiS
LGRVAHFYFIGALSDFLAPDLRGESVACAFNPGQSVKHLVESLGIPHTEVQAIEVNGSLVDFSYLVEDGDQVQVYPLTAEKLSADPRFILDNHLGRLAVYLRMLGFDSLYRNDFQDEELAHLSSEQARILLTRDRRLLMRNLVTHGYWLRSKKPQEQLSEVVSRYDLSSRVVPFRYCIRCNGLLQPVEKEKVLDRLQPLTRRYFDDFRICADCGQIYWKGSHYERMQRLIEQVIR